MRVKQKKKFASFEIKLNEYVKKARVEIAWIEQKSKSFSSFSQPNGKLIATEIWFFEWKKQVGVKQRNLLETNVTCFLILVEFRKVQWADHFSFIAHHIAPKPISILFILEPQFAKFIKYWMN